MRRSVGCMVVGLGLCMAGCIDFFAEPPPEPEAGVEATPEAGVEPRPEVGVEPRPDLGVEPRPDLGVEPLPDVGVEPDARVDAASDMRPDPDDGMPSRLPVGVGPAYGDQFGYAIATTDRLVAIGAPGTRGVGPAAGKVYLYDVPDQGWANPQLLRMQTPSWCGGDGFGNAVDIWPGALVVGAYRFGARNPDICPGRTAEPSSGAAFVFEPGPAGAWEQVAMLAEDGLRTYDAYGRSVAIWGDLIVVGAPGVDEGCAGYHNTDDEDGCGGDCRCNSGRAYVYRRVADREWAFEGNLEPKTRPQHGDGFGWAVDVHEGLIAVSAHNRGAAGMASQAGTVYLFRRRGGVWQETALIDAPAAPVPIQFGFNLALDGTTLAVSARDVSDSPDYAGAVDVYDIEPAIGPDGDDTVELRQQVVPGMGRRGYDLFGHSLALDGERLLVGAPGKSISTPGRPGFATCPEDRNPCLYCAPEPGDLDGVRCEPAGEPVCDPCEGDCLQCRAGVAYVFRGGGDRWVSNRLTPLLRTEAPALRDRLGTSAAWFGGHALVGMPQTAERCGGGCETGPGAVHVFEVPE